MPEHFPYQFQIHCTGQRNTGIPLLCLITVLRRSRRAGDIDAVFLHKKIYQKQSRLPQDRISSFLQKFPVILILPILIKFCAHPCPAHRPHRPCDAVFLSGLFQISHTRRIGGRPIIAVMMMHETSAAIINSGCFLPLLTQTFHIIKIGCQAFF